MQNAAPQEDKPVKRMTGQQAAEHIIEQAEHLRELSSTIGAYELRELFHKIIDQTRKFIKENSGEHP